MIYNVLSEILQNIADGNKISSLNTQVLFIDYLISIGGQVGPDYMNMINSNTNLFPKYKNEFLKLKKKLETFRKFFLKTQDRRKIELKKGLEHYDIPNEIKNIIINKTLNKELFR